MNVDHIIKKIDRMIEIEDKEDSIKMKVETIEMLIEDKIREVLIVVDMMEIMKIVESLIIGMIFEITVTQEEIEEFSREKMKIKDSQIDGTIEIIEEIMIEMKDVEIIEDIKIDDYLIN